jgi:hypothetical protein
LLKSNNILFVYSSKLSNRNALFGIFKISKVLKCYLESRSRKKKCFKLVFQRCSSIHLTLLPLSKVFCWLTFFKRSMTSSKSTLNQQLTDKIFASICLEFVLEILLKGAFWCVD